MQEVMFNPGRGYYKVKNPIGESQDFITAPEISSVFSQLIAGYFFSFISQNNPDQKISFVEMGAGTGTMFFDMLETFLALEKKLGSNILSQINFSIIEKNPTLAKIQQEKLSSLNLKVFWFENFEDFLVQNQGRKIYFACNELFDCFSINQFSYSNEKWQEILLDLDKNQNLTPVLEAFNEAKHKLIEKIAKKNLALSFDKSNVIDSCLGPARAHGTVDSFAEKNKIFEHSFEALNFMDELSKAIKKTGGVALIIDYGYVESPLKSTLQAIKNHKKTDIFKEEDPYSCDLTSLVNFHALEKQAQKNLLQTSLITQKEFLTSLGIEEKRQNFIKNSPDQEKNINLAINRLISKDEMGELFKCLIIW